MLLVTLLSSPSWSQTLDDLVHREGIYYQKFTDVPFTGKITGEQQGSLKNGEKDGAWVEYYGNGQLEFQGNYKNGKRDGAWISYWDNGLLRFKSNYKSGMTEGDWVQYHENGQLSYKGNYKNGKRDGAWIAYNENGTVFKAWTATFKDGVKISD